MAIENPTFIDDLTIQTSIYGGFSIAMFYDQRVTHEIKELNMVCDGVCVYIYIYIVELRTPAMPVGVGGGKERGGFHLNLRT